MDPITVGYIAYKIWRWATKPEETEIPEAPESGDSLDEFGEMLDDVMDVII